MVSNQQFRLKWNNHRNTVLQEFESLLHNNSFVDCTIGADGKYLKAHKIVLSACSPYLQNVFSEHFDKHPVILLKDVSFKELKCMIDYMYCGEVNISECELPSFLRTAQSLKIKGLAEDIHDYDSGSDNETESRPFSENGAGRTVEANVEIHDEDGPPAKKSTPSLISANALNNSFSSRKRKIPNPVPSTGKATSQVKTVSGSTPNTEKSADGNVPSSENSDNTLCSTMKENCVVKDETNDSCKKPASQKDTQETVNSRTEVKEELLDTDADNDDNSSYECMNNPCEDSDPLNEDSESTTGNKFSEVSIASVSAYNENDTNDDSFKIKSEAFSEVVIIPDQLEQLENKLLSSEELGNDPASYCISENEDELRNSIIVEVKPLTGDYEAFSHVVEQVPIPRSRKALLRRCRDKTKEAKLLKTSSSVKITKVRTSKAEKEKPKYESNHHTFRRILPASMKPSLLPAILPHPVTSSVNAPSSVQYTVTSKGAKQSSQETLSAASVTPSGGSYQVIKVPGGQQFCSDISADLPQMLCPTDNVDDFCHGASLMLNSSQTPQLTSASSDLSRLSGAEMSGNIILLNPTSRVMLLNSDVSSDPVYTLTSPGTSDAGVARRGRRRSIVKPSKVLTVQKNPVNDLSAIIRHTAAISNTAHVGRIMPVTKFRKIAPSPASNTSTSR